MADIKLTEKFIGYVDILGFKSLMRAVDTGKGLSHSELFSASQMLGVFADRDNYIKYGPTMCPESPRIRKDLDFHLTQQFDSVVLSAEISPAGVINLISHCWVACINLLTKGLMCRGYIKRGLIYHTEKHVYGPGHLDVIEKEQQVAFFKRDADERATPFIQVDQEVVNYIANLPDECVKKMFSRFVVTDGGLTALFPINSLSHTIFFGGGDPFKADKEKHSNNIVRTDLSKLKELILKHIDSLDQSAVRKSEHYIRAIDTQLTECDQTDKFIDEAIRPSPRGWFAPR